MAKITKLVFDIKGKEYIFWYDDAKELYQEMGKIFNAKPTKQQFEYDPPPVGAILPLKDDQISFNTIDDSITVSNYDWAAAPAAQPKRSNDPWVGTTYAFQYDAPYVDTRIKMG